MKFRLSTAYGDDNALPYPVQTLNPNSESIGEIIGRTRSDGTLTPPESDRGTIGVVLAVDWLLRQIDRAGVILDSGDIIVGMTKVVTTSNTMDMATWAAMNFVMLCVTGYLLWPSGKRLVTGLHKWARERYAQRKSRSYAKGRNG